MTCRVVLGLGAIISKRTQLSDYCASSMPSTMHVLLQGKHCALGCDCHNARIRPCYISAHLLILVHGTCVIMVHPTPYA